MGTDKAYSDEKRINNFFKKIRKDNLKRRLKEKKKKKKR